jgi:hypothetical protein
MADALIGVILSEAKSPPRAPRGDLSVCTQGILRSPSLRSDSLRMTPALPSISQA